MATVVSQLEDERVGAAGLGSDETDFLAAEDNFVDPVPELGR
jgi:hypothetical protein